MRLKRWTLPPWLVWTCVGVIALASFFEGIRVRRWMYDLTGPIRFTSDIQRGCYWGLEASGPEGYLNQYEKMAPEQPEWKDGRWSVWLDYSPLRLLVMSRWGAWLREHHKFDPETDPLQAWQRDYAYTAPVLHFNTAMDLLGAGCAFFLTRLWVRRSLNKSDLTPFTGLWQGLAAALLLWFNPAMLISAYGWPTWDAWIVPMYLLACLLASLDLWFCAGLAIGAGAMFKGQQLAVAVVFIIWPLVRGQFSAALRWCAGLVFAFGLLASPWLISYLDPDQLAKARQIQDQLPVTSYPADLFKIARMIDAPALFWIAAVLLAMGLLPWLARRFAPPQRDLQLKWTDRLLQPRGPLLGLAALGVAVAVMWPWSLARNHAVAWHGPIVGVSLAAAALAVPLRRLPYLLAAATGAGLLLCMEVFHGSHSWCDCAFHFGTIHWPWLVVGRTSNLPGLLQERFGWAAQDTDAIALTISPITWLHLPEIDLTIKQLCNGIFLTLLPIAGIAIGLQARRNDRRVLIALITPWLLFFTFPVQIHERYLLFAAGAAVICIGQSIGMTLLALFLTAVTSVMTLHVMLDSGDRYQFGQNLSTAFPWLFSPDCGDTVYRYIQGTYPDMAWAILITTAIFMYVSLTRSPRGKAEKKELFTNGHESSLRNMENAAAAAS